MSFGDGGSGGCGAEFHDRNVAFEPEIEGGVASFGFEENRFGDDVTNRLRVLMVLGRIAR